MIPDPPSLDLAPVAGGEGGPARDGSGEPSRAAGQVCYIVGCNGGPRVIKGLCPRHYQQQYRHQKSHPPKKTLPPVVVACPEDLEPLVAQLVENDARPIFMLLWRAIGDWHLQGILEEAAS